VYWFPKTVDLFGFSVDALWCTSFQRLLIYLAFLLMLFGVQYIKEHQQESQISQQPLETRTNNKFNLLRNSMLIELNMLDMGGLPVNIDILLFGNDDLSVEIVVGK
jgi:hypothetical protein